MELLRYYLNVNKETDHELLEARTEFTYRGQPTPPFFLTDFYGGPEANDFWMNNMGSRVIAISVAGLYDRQGGYNCTSSDIDSSAPRLESAFSITMEIPVGVEQYMTLACAF